MIDILLLMMFSSLWSIILINDLILVKNTRKFLYKIYSPVKIINGIILIMRKVLSCNQCFSYWLFSFTYLLVYSSFLGFLIGPVVYYLTFIISKWYHKISI